MTRDAQEVLRPNPGLGGDQAASSSSILPHPTPAPGPKSPEPLGRRARTSRTSTAKKPKSVVRKPPRGRRRGSSGIERVIDGILVFGAVRDSVIILFASRRGYDLQCGRRGQDRRVKTDRPGVRTSRSRRSENGEDKRRRWEDDDGDLMEESLVPPRPRPSRLRPLEAPFLVIPR